jgi:hypothetical protein
VYALVEKAAAGCSGGEGGSCVGEGHKAEWGMRGGWSMARRRRWPPTQRRGSGHMTGRGQPRTAPCSCRAGSRAPRLVGAGGGGSIKMKQCSERFLADENE